MVTLHVATSLRNNADGFTVRWRGQHPINCNTLRYAFRQRQGLNEECVVKSTVCGITAQVSSMLFTTLGFYSLRYRRRFDPLVRPFIF
jgi:hypothetical protein